MLAGQCPGGVCPAPTFPISAPIRAAVSPVGTDYTKLHWRKANADEWQLYYGDKRLAGWRESDKFFLAARADGSWPTGACPCGEACKCGQNPCTCVSADVPNYGLDLSKMNAAQTYQLGPRQVSQAECYQAVGKGGTLADDTGRDFVVYVGDDPTGFETKAAGLRDRYHVQGYKPGEPMAASRGLTAPGVYAIAPDGSRLGFRADVPDLATLLDWLRRLREPAPSPLPIPLPDGLKNLPTWAWLAGAVVLYLLTRKPNVQS